MTCWADQHIGHVDGPLAVARWCKVCKFTDTLRKLPRGTAGRGWGLREGNKQRGRLIQHVKAAHPELAPSGRTEP